MIVWTDTFPITLKQKRFRHADITSITVHVSTTNFFVAKKLNNIFSKRWNIRAEEKIVPK